MKMKKLMDIILCFNGTDSKDGIMMLYIQTKQGKLIGPYPEEIAERLSKEYPKSILITEIMRKRILRNQLENRRNGRY